MDLVSGIVVYVILWWWILFMVLPVGVRRETEVVPGNDVGAPQKTMLPAKLVATTAIAAVVWVIVDQIVRSDLISFRDMIKDWM
jgi:predicted secreted protein